MAIATRGKRRCMPSKTPLSLPGSSSSATGSALRVTRLSLLLRAATHTAPATSASARTRTPRAPQAKHQRASRGEWVGIDGPQSIARLVPQPGQKTSSPGRPSDQRGPDGGRPQHVAAGVGQASIPAIDGDLRPSARHGQPLVQTRDDVPVRPGRASPPRSTDDGARARRCHVSGKRHHRSERTPA
jgi:hypothetical protein